MTNRDNIDKYRSPVRAQENSSAKPNYNLQEEYAERDLAEGNLIQDLEDGTLDAFTAMQMFRKGSR